MTIIFKSPYPDVHIAEDAAIWNKLEEHALENGDKAAFVCGMSERSLSFAEVFKMAQFLVAGLLASGIKKGDVRACIRCLAFEIQCSLLY